MKDRVIFNVALRFTTLIIGLLLSLAVIYSFTTSVNAQPQDVTLRSEIRYAATNEQGSKLFLLHNNSTVSVYDVEKKQFLVSSKSIVGLANIIDIMVSPDGERVVLINGGVTIGDPATINILPTSQLIGSGGIDFSTVFQANLGVVRGVASSFSPDGRIFVLANTAQGRIQVFYIEKKEKYEVATGISPSALTFNSSGNTLFVLNTASENVNVIDLNARKLVASIPVGAEPIGIVFNSRTNKLFVSNVASANISVIDAATLKVLKEVPVGKQPGSLTYDSKEGSVFVANNSDGTLSIIAPDLTVKTLDLKSPAYFHEAPMRLSYSKIASRLFILSQSVAQYFIYDTQEKRIVKEGKTDTWPKQLLSNENSARVLIRHFDAPILMINLASLQEERIPAPTGTQEQKITYFSSPQSIVVDEDTNKIYVSNLGSGTITVIDGNTQKPTAVIPVAQTPQVIALNSATKKIYVTSPVDNLITIIDIKDPSYSQKTITVGKMPRTISANEVSNKIYVSNSGDGTVSVIDGKRDTIIATIDLGGPGNFPLVTSINREKNEIYVANYGSDSIAVIDGKTDTVGRFIRVGKNPLWVRYEASLGQLYVTVEGEKKFLRINPQTYEIAETISLDITPYRIFSDLETHLVYVNHRKDGDVTIIRPPESQSGKSAIIKEMAIPYYGQTDTIYNMVAINSKTGLQYFTYGTRNQVKVIKVDRVGEERIWQPTWFATINGNGEVSLNPAFEQKIPPPAYRYSQIFLAWASFGGIIVLILAACFLWLKKKSQ